MRWAQWCAGVLVSGVISSLALADTASILRDLTGVHTRVVWCQDTSKKSGDVFAHGKDLVLMGLDSEDGKGPRVIHSGLGNYHKPLLTPAGERVIFTQEHNPAVYVVDFDGGNLREVCKGVAAEVWQDPRTGEEWVYFQTKKNKKAPLHRARIDKPKDHQLVWNRTPLSLDNFQLSADGTRAGGLFPWSAGGVAELPNKGWKKLAGGCWTSLSPDNSYLFWIFDGPHRNVYVHDVRNGGKWKVDIHNAPGIDRWEVYHPRWSNHARFLAMTGPYKGGRMGGNNIQAGGPAVEVYVGRFAPDFKSVEKWVRVTNNSKADFYPDVWVKGGEKVSAAASREKARENLLAELDPPDTADPGKLKAWPGDTRKLVFLWEGLDATNDIEDADGKHMRTCMVEFRGKAIPLRFGRADLAGGALVALDVNKPLLEACQRTNQLSVEAVITPANVKQSGPARIVSFSTNASARNFTLGQDGDRLVFRLRTPATGGNGVNPQVDLCKVEAGKTYHVVVAYADGRLACYVNGKPVLVSNAVTGDFSNWEPHHLILGDEHEGGRDWQGAIEGVAVYARFTGPAEAKKKHELFARRFQDRKPLAQLVVEAKLVKATPTPDPKELKDYTRALVPYIYEVQKVVQGKYDGRRIQVAHWALLDRKATEFISRRAAGEGKTFRLTLEPYADHEELEGERLLGEEDLDLKMYVDVGER